MSSSREDDNSGGKRQDGKQEGQESSRKAAGNKKRNLRFLWIFGGVLALLGIAAVLYYLGVARYYVSTADAYVNGDLVTLSPQVSGTVTEITVDETQAVNRGQLLVRLDAHDSDVALAQARANLAQTVRDVAQLFDQEKSDLAAVAAQEAALKLADQNLTRTRGLIDAHGVSQQDLERDQANHRSAAANLRQARAALEAARAAITGTRPETHPRVLLAAASFRAAWLASDRTRILSPVSGYVVRRLVQVGQQVSTSTQMMTIVPLETVWIDANFKENQLANVRIGQPVRVTADLYGPSVKYQGTVLGLTAGTGAALAVLPPQNATGNWIKIVQRLPVRVGVPQDELRAHPLFLGLSMNIKIDAHDTRGRSLAPVPVFQALRQTDVYAAQDAGVEPEIQRIIDENLKGRRGAMAQAAP